MQRLLAVVLILGCADFGPTEELSGARERWKRHGPASYDLTIERTCECLPSSSGPIVVLVRNGAIESRTPEPDPFDAPRVTDVPGLFDQIAAAITAGALGRIAYDFATGYPRFIEFDSDGPDIVDGEIYLSVRLRAP